MNVPQSEIVDIIKNPVLGLRYANRVYHKLTERSRSYPRAIDYLNEDWDNLLILDACRYDVFKENSKLSGTTEARYSMCANTGEFLAKNFDGRSDPEIVYITANSQISAKDINVYFHEFIDVWESEWIEDVGVPPEILNKKVIEANDKYPNKRLLVHYIQPHLPFLSDVGQTIQQEHEQSSRSEESLWQSLRKGQFKVKKKTLKKAYTENLQRVIEAVSKLLPELVGKTVITSDHGQLLGDRIGPIPTAEFGHPPNLYDEHLVQVPWHIIPFESRKKIIEGAATPYRNTADQNLVREQLRQLGYVE